MNFLRYKLGLFFLVLSSCMTVYSQQALNKELGRSINVQKEALDEMLDKADSLSGIKKNKEAKEIYDTAFDLIKKGGDMDNIEDVGFRIGSFFINNSEEYVKSMELFSFLKKNCSIDNNVECISIVYVQLGLLYNSVGEYVKALESYNKALALAEKIDNPHVIWEVLINRGGLLLDIGYFDYARKDFKNALSCVENEGFRVKKRKTYLNLSASFPDTQPDSTLYYSRLGLVGCEKEMTRDCANIYNNIAWSYYLKKQPKKALKIIEKNVKLDSDYMIYSYFDNLYPAITHTLGSIEYALKKYDKAIEYFKISEKNFEKKRDISNLIIVKEDLSVAYEKIGNLKNSIRLLKEIKSLESEQLKLRVSKEWAKNEIGSLVKAKEQVISGLEEKNLIIKKQVDKTKWVSYFLGGLLFITLCVLVYRGYKSRIRYYQISEKLVLTRLTSLRASMNPHFLFNTFSTLQNYILKNDNLRANEYMTELSGLIRNVLNSSDSVYIDFITELEILKSYVSLQKGRFRGEFDAIFDVNPVLLKLNPKIPSMIIQPFIENAIIHGFPHSKIKGELKITLQKNNNIVKCIVVDNGIGRDASERIKNKAKENTHLSIATENTNERLNILNKTVIERSSVIINDLLDDQGDAKGTEVIIALPIINELN